MTWGGGETFWGETSREGNGLGAKCLGTVLSWLTPPTHLPCYPETGKFQQYNSPIVGSLPKAKSFYLDGHCNRILGQVLQPV